METEYSKGLLATCSEPENTDSEIHGGATHAHPDSPTVSEKKDEASMEDINKQDKADEIFENVEVKTEKNTEEYDTARNEASKELMTENMASSMPANVEGEPHSVSDNDGSLIVSEMIEEASTMLVDGHGKANEMGKIEVIQPDNRFEVDNSPSNKKTKKIVRTVKKKPEAPTVSVNAVSTPVKMMKKKMNAVNVMKLTEVTQCHKSSEGDEKELEGDGKPESVQVAVIPQVDEDKGMKDLKYCDEIQDDATLPRILSTSEMKESSITALNEQDKGDERSMDEDVKNHKKSPKENSTALGKDTRKMMNEKTECSMPQNVEGDPHGVVNNALSLIESERTKETSFMLVDGLDKAKEKGKAQEVQHDKKFVVVNSSSNMQTKKIVRKRKKILEEALNDPPITMSKPAKVMKPEMIGANAVNLKEAKLFDKSSEGKVNKVKGDGLLKSVEKASAREGKEENKGMEDVKTNEKVEGSMKERVKIVKRKKLFAKANSGRTNTKSAAIKLVNAESVAVSLVSEEESKKQKFEIGQSFASASPSIAPSVEKMDAEDSKDDACEAGKVDIASDRKPEFVKMPAFAGSDDRNVKHAKIVKMGVGAAKKIVKVGTRNKFVSNAKGGNTNSEPDLAKLRKVEGVAAMMVGGDISKKEKDTQRVKVGNLASGTTKAVTAIERSDVEDLKDDANVEEKEGIASVQKDKGIRKRKRPVSNATFLNAGKPINPDKPSSSAADKHTRKVDSADKHLKRADGMGLIFMCNAKTKKDCYRYKILGLPESKKEIVAKVYKGMRLFLFDVDLKLMYGIYKAASSGGYNIEPKAFASKYPSQVRFTVLNDCCPLPEDKFRAAIKENYYGRHKFDCQLSPEQVRNLCKLFQKEKAEASMLKLWGDTDPEAKRRPIRNFGRTYPAKDYTHAREGYRSPPHRVPYPSQPSYIREQPIRDYYSRRENAVLDGEMTRDPVVEYQVPNVFYREPLSYREPMHYSRLRPEYSPPHPRPSPPHLYRY